MLFWVWFLHLFVLGFFGGGGGDFVVVWLVFCGFFLFAFFP